MILLNTKTVKSPDKLIETANIEIAEDGMAVFYTEHEVYHARVSTPVTVRNFITVGRTTHFHSKTKPLFFSDLLLTTTGFDIATAKLKAAGFFRQFNSTNLILKDPESGKRSDKQLIELLTKNRLQFNWCPKEITLHPMSVTATLRSMELLHPLLEPLKIPKTICVVGMGDELKYSKDKGYVSDLKDTDSTYIAGVDSGVKMGKYNIK